MTTASDRIVSLASRWRHALLTLAGVEHEGAFRADRVVAAVSAACEQCGLRVEREYDYRFQPTGSSQCAFGSDFRIIVHTWPERGSATADIYLDRAATSLDELIAAVCRHTGWTVVARSEMTRSPGDRP